MKITKRQLRRIIKEEKRAILYESVMSERHMEVGDAILDAISQNPGAAGDDIIEYVTKELSDYGMVSPDLVVTKEEIYAVLDDLLDDNQVFFDEEEDAWFDSEQDLLAWKKGGVYTDQQDYEAGFKR